MFGYVKVKYVCLPLYTRLYAAIVYLAVLESLHRWKAAVRAANATAAVGSASNTLVKLVQLSSTIVYARYAYRAAWHCPDDELIAPPEVHKLPVTGC